MQNIVGNAAKFNLTGLKEVPKLDLPDLAHFFKTVIKLSQRRLGISPDGKYSFITPDDWNNEYAIKDKYENLVFKRKPTEGEICGVGHKIFSKALDFALSFVDNVCLIDSQFSYFVYRVYDKITYQKSSIENKYIICKYYNEHTVEWMSEENFYQILPLLKEYSNDEIIGKTIEVPVCFENLIHTQTKEYEYLFRELGYELFAVF